MLGRLGRLSLREWLDLGPALWRLVLIRISLRGGIRTTRERFSGRSSEHSSVSAKSLTLDPWYRRAVALRRAARFVPGAHCLARALALRWWMRGVGLDAKLVIGVRRTTDGIASHAWVELDGHPIDESEQTVRDHQVINHERAMPGTWTR